MAAGAPAAFQSENTRVRPLIIDVFHVRSSSTARHTKCNSRQTRRGSASPQSAHTSSLNFNFSILMNADLATSSAARRSVLTITIVDRERDRVEMAPLSRR